MRRESGFLSVVALILIIVVTALAIALGYLISGSTLASSGRTGAMQALFVTESGLESENLRWAQNLDWYRSTSDPNPTAPVPQAVGGGTFTASTSLAGTMLTAQASDTAVVINAYTTSRFPASGYLQLEEDLTANGEIVRYTGIAGNTFTGVTRGQTVGTATSVAAVHDRSSIVYPLTILRTALAADCNPLASIQVDANSKFLTAGTLDIEGEEISYAGSATSGGTTTLTGITRCLGLVASVAHAAGQPVTPVLAGDDSASYQAEIVSTGTMGVDVRYERRTIER